MRLARSFLLVTLTAVTYAQAPSRSGEVEAIYSDARALYLDLHQNPELSSHETQTAAKLAGRLRDLGYAVTEHDSGRDVGVMHACGHDVHMASLFGTAAIMAHNKAAWHGTLILIGQPAEETISGAKRMIEDGLMTRFPKPDVALALHVGNQLAAGKVGLGPGHRFSNADSLRITIYGKGGHGSQPNSTIDPIVIAARTVVALQTIVSREVKPGEVAVVTIGYIQAGTKNNIIPDQAELGITVRSYKPEVRKQVLAAIARITKAEANAAGALREPKIEHYEATDAVYNDPALTQRLEGVLESTLGKENVVVEDPGMASEDFSFFTAQGIPSFYFSLGGADPDKFTEAKATGTNLPSNHSPLFAPDVDLALHTGIAAEVALLRNLLNGSADELRKSVPSGH